jgi:hypothetical protein
MVLDGNNDLWIYGSGGTFVVTEPDVCIADLGSGTHLYPIVIDGSNNVWSGGLSKYINDSTQSTPSAPLALDLRSYGGYIAIDGSGDVWIASSIVTEYIGIASPVVTPQAAAVATGTIGALP